MKPILFIAILVLCLVRWLPTAGLPFWADDYTLLFNIHAHGIMQSIAQDPLGNYFRPLARAVIYGLLPMNPFIFRVLILGFLVGTASLLAVLTKRFGLRASLIAALLFVFNPIISVPLYWIAAGIQEFGAICVGLLAVLFFMRGGLLLATITGIVAMLFKETGGLPLCIVAGIAFCKERNFRLAIPFVILGLTAFLQTRLGDYPASGLTFHSYYLTPLLAGVVILLATNLIKIRTSLVAVVVLLAVLMTPVLDARSPRYCVNDTWRLGTGTILTGMTITQNYMRDVMAAIPELHENYRINIVNFGADIGWQLNGVPVLWYAYRNVQIKPNGERRRYMFTATPPGRHLKLAEVGQW